MNPTDIGERLRALPPDLAAEPSRFDDVRTRVQRRRRRRAATTAVAALAVVAVAVPVTARVATALSSADGHAIDPSARRTQATETALPGTDRVTALSAAVTHDGAGTATIPLGSRPARANGVRLTVTCLSPGTLSWHGGGSMSCGPGDHGERASAWENVRLEPGQDSLRLRAAAGVSWRLTSTYVAIEHTAWAVNAHGETYGADNGRGSPDLVAVMATNGRQGYARATDLDGPMPTSPADALAQRSAHAGPRAIPVYESDGRTVIGEFRVGSGE